MERKAGLSLSGEEGRRVGGGAGGRAGAERVITAVGGGGQPAAQLRSQINVFAVEHKAGLCPALPCPPRALTGAQGAGEVEKWGTQETLKAGRRWSLGGGLVEGGLCKVNPGEFTLTSEAHRSEPLFSHL